jgi:hypothetical protein
MHEQWDEPRKESPWTGLMNRYRFRFAVQEISVGARGTTVGAV